MEKGVPPLGVCGNKGNNNHRTNDGHNQEAEIHQAENFYFAHTQDLLARGTELLKRTRKGVISVLIFLTLPIRKQQGEKHWSDGSFELLMQGIFTGK